MENDRILETVYDAVEAETRRLGSALGAYRRTDHALGPKGDIVADLGPIKAKGRSVTLRRNPHEREGSGERLVRTGCGLDAAGRATPSLLAAVRRLIDPIDRMIRRDDAIMTLTDEQLAADGFLCPKWSYSAHPLLIAMMAADRYDPQDLVRLPYRHTANGPILTGEPRHIPTRGAPAPRGNPTDVAGEIRLDVLDVDMYEHRAGPVALTYMSGRGYRARLCVAGTPRIPESMLASLKGVPLDDVIRHPAWGGSLPGAIVREVANHPDYMLITLEAALAPLAKPPEGMDTSWRSTISRWTPRPGCGIPAA